MPIASPPSALPTLLADYQSVEGLQRHVQAVLTLGPQT